NEKLSKDFGFKDQIRRSAVSIPSNIAEGFGREGNREFSQFLSVSKGSLYELKTQVLIGLEIGYITVDEFNKLSDMIEESSRMITGLMSYLKTTELKGSKYNNQVKQ